MFWRIFIRIFCSVLRIESVPEVAAHISVTPCISLGPLSALIHRLSRNLAMLHPQLHYCALLRYGLIRRVTFSKRARSYALSQRVLRRDQRRNTQIQYSNGRLLIARLYVRVCVCAQTLLLLIISLARGERTKATVRYCCKTLNCFWNVALMHVNGRIAENTLYCMYATGWQLIN